MASVLADVRGYFSAEASEWDGPVEGRVLLGRGQLVLAASDDDTVTIPLQSVFDVTVGDKPTFFDPMPGTPVTVAYNDGVDRVAATVSGDENTIEKFATLLFKALLNGTEATIKHPARVGGRVVDSSYRAALLGLDAGAVQFDTDEGPVTVRLDSVVDFDRETRTVDGDDRPVLVVSHMDDGTDLTTLAATDSARTLSLLGRFLRQQYQAVLASLRDLSLSEPETETLATIYAAGDVDVSLASVLGVEPKVVKRILHSLHEKGLIESGETGPTLTAKGQIVVNHYLERVNA
ncbi:MAG: CheF family chemotaxis protein [Haloarculaceae archaeon]